MLVYWLGSQCRSFYEQSESATPHFPSLGVAMVDWQIRQTHFEYDIVEKSPPPILDGSVKFGFSLGTAPPLIFITFL